MRHAIHFGTRDAEAKTFEGKTVRWLPLVFRCHACGNRYGATLEHETPCPHCGAS